MTTMTEEVVQKKRQEQCMREHSYGDAIERVLRKILGVDYSSEEGSKKVILYEIDASDCAKHPFLTIKAGLFYYLALHPNISKTVIDFIQEYSAIADMSTYDVLSFVTKDDEINNFILGENGEKYLEKMIEDFRTIVR